MRIAVSITLFLLFQVAAALLFKWGSAGGGRYWFGCGCNTIGGSIEERLCR